MDIMEMVKKEMNNKDNVNEITALYESCANGEISLEDVPEECKTEVEEIINSQEKLYTLDEAAAIITSEVAGNE